MKNIGIVPNLDKDTKLIVTKEIIQFLLENNCTPVLPVQIAEAVSMPGFGASIEDIYKSVEFLIVLGGDGTLLNVGRRAAQYNTPLLGINLGTLGFLTDTEASGAFQSIESVLKGDYIEEKRLMLEASILNKSIVSESHIALNDVCVTRGAFSKLVDLRVHVNKEYLDTFRADGIIISTPTGSTAYNLSAGGPILKPDTRMVAITPICPHAIHSRSVVISDDDIVTIEIGKNSRGDFLLSVDGQSGSPLDRDSIIQVKRSSFYTTIIKTNKLGFYDILRKKLVRNEG